MDMETPTNQYDLPVWSGDAESGADFLKSEHYFCLVYYSDARTAKQNSASICMKLSDCKDSVHIQAHILGNGKYILINIERLS